jgi:hypothetical protein
MNVLQIETPVHGRVLFDERSEDRLLVGFHGYGETAEVHRKELEQIPGIGEWSVAAVQALHPFYSKGGTILGASWMTSLDRELAIGDNINYVRRVIAHVIPSVSEGPGRPGGARYLPPLTGSLADARDDGVIVVFLGFSQGAAMAARAAAHIESAGLIMIGGDFPPDVRGKALPPTLLIRGKKDEWYTEEKFKEDLRFFPRVRTLVHEGGHEWNDQVRAAAGEFLAALKRSHPS